MMPCFASRVSSLTHDKTLVFRLLKNFRRPSQKILFIHISKTAGTSFRLMLEEYYGKRMVYPGDFYRFSLPNGWYPSGSEMLKNYAKLPSHSVLVGHFTAAMADMVPRIYRAVTFVREPIQRSLSVLAHFSHTLKIPVDTLVEDSQFMSMKINNFQTRILGADGVCDLHQVEAADDHMLARALSRLETLDFVGITERFEESCQKFDSQFQTRISRLVRRENVFRPEGCEFAQHIPKIKPHIERDQILYDAAVKRFKK
jgi:hypothetical protein